MQEARRLASDPGAWSWGPQNSSSMVAVNARSSEIRVRFRGLTKKRAIWRHFRAGAQKPDREMTARCVLLMGSRGNTRPALPEFLSGEGSGGHFRSVCIFPFHILWTNSGILSVLELIYAHRWPGRPALTEFLSGEGSGGHFRSVCIDPCSLD